MTPQFTAYLDLVGRLETEVVNRSENDLSSRLARAFESLGLHTVVDTGGGADRRGRPDISCYVDAGAADLVTAADVLVEAKKPEEVAGFADLSAALASPGLWAEKFVRYVRAHSQQVSYFALTSFERFLAVPISAEIRAATARRGAEQDEARKRAGAGAAREFDLRDAAGRFAWVEWCSRHLAPAALRPPPPSTTLNLASVADTSDLERFAEALADVVAGKGGRDKVGAALVSSIDLRARSVEDLDEGIRNSLVLHTVAQHSGMTMEAAATLLEDDLEAELAGFVAASVHSLVGRLFAFKTIEDCFCAGEETPLVERDLWVFDTDRYDQLTPEALPAAMFAAMRDLARARNPVVSGLAATGRFYDWIAGKVDPAAFRRLVAPFFANDLGRLDGDLLGRFFEIYSQRINRRQRRARGQYHTPMPIVGFMWRWALSVVRGAGVLDDLVALDPGVGSAAFLVEGVRQLDDAGIPRFWERLYGFDIDAQVLGIAQTNLYLAVLGRLERSQADEVGEMKLYPTDTLDSTNGTRLRRYLPLYVPGLREFLRARIELSERVKQADRFDIVIGNPPYFNNSRRTLQQVAQVFPRLLATSRANARARARNIGDDYAWFFAAADHYIRGRGLIAFVVSDSFCYALSYRFFRQDVLRLYEVRGLVRLGTGVFADVSPRTSFVIVVLERRAAPARPNDPPQEFDLVDLRPLAAGTDLDDLGTEADPRLRALSAAAGGTAGPGLPPAVRITPAADNFFAFYPADPIVARVRTSGPPMHQVTAGEPRFFLKRWPGIVTAFDDLFRAGDPAALEGRMRTFFALAAAGAPRTPEPQAVQAFALEHGIDAEAAAGRLQHLLRLARDGGLAFDAARVRRTLSGNAPDEANWYPDAAQTTWVYYEPRLKVARNVHEGRDPGYGTMTQWRDDCSHGITPKIAYTSSANPDRGLKAFVLHDPWMVKIHGGTRQQFNYTGLDNPMKQRRLDGLPNNLGVEALRLYSALVERGRPEDDVLFYVAALYNSETARIFLAQGGRDQLNVPVDLARVGVMSIEQLADAGRASRNLRWLEFLLGGEGRIDATLADDLFDEPERSLLDLRAAVGGSRRFRARPAYVPGDATAERIGAELERLQVDIDRISNDLYNA